MMKTKRIESETNALYKTLLSLTSSKGVREENLCLVSGEKVIPEVLEQIEKEKAYWVFHSEEHELFQHLAAQIVLLPKPLFKNLDVLGTQSPLLVTPVPELKKWDPQSEAQGIEVLCALGDPNNLGALMRSAEAFGFKSLVLLKECSHPYLPKVTKSSSGSNFRLNLKSGPSIKELQDVRKIFALDGNGLALKDVKVPHDARLLLGEEGQGIPQDLKVQKISIPIEKDVESLNATVAASVLFYELSQRR